MKYASLCHTVRRFAATFTAFTLVGTMLSPSILALENVADDPITSEEVATAIEIADTSEVSESSSAEAEKNNAETNLSPETLDDASADLATQEALDEIDAEVDDHDGATEAKRGGRFRKYKNRCSAKLYN